MSQSEHALQKIAIALAFSPRCEAMMAEGRYLQEVLGARLYFIHIGSASIQEEQYVKHLMHRFQLDENRTQMVWKDGDPVEEILAFCLAEDIDLLVAGALEKESLLKYFLGGISRQLSRKVKCSMLMLTEPNIHPKGFKHLVVEGTDHPKTANTISVAVELGKACNAEWLDVIQETDPGKLALVRSEELKENEADEKKEALLREEDEKLGEILRCTDCGKMVLNTERREGKPGYVISQYARSKEADLLVVNSPDKQMNLIDRVFPHDIEYALADLPCNLLIVHPKGRD